MEPLKAPEFHEAVQRLAADRPELGIDMALPDAAAPSLLAVSASEDLENWLDRTATLAEGVDRRTAAAYLVSILASQLGKVLAGLFMAGVALPALTAADVIVSQDVRGQGTARSMAFRFGFGCALRPGEPSDQPALSRSIIAIHAPLIAALHARTGLARRALWRLVTDEFAEGFLAYGKAAGCVDAARAAAKAVLAPEPLHNPQWAFIAVNVDGHPPHWFRQRGGCCRIYRTVGGTYCTTCVLRSHDSQLQRLREVVARQ